jgi:hypothetical protein
MLGRSHPLLLSTPETSNLFWYMFLSGGQPEETLVKSLTENWLTLVSLYQSSSLATVLFHCTNMHHGNNMVQRCVTHHINLKYNRCANHIGQQEIATLCNSSVSDMHTQTFQDHELLHNSLFECAGVRGFQGYRFDCPYEILVPIAPRTRWAPPQAEFVRCQMLHDMGLLPQREWHPLTLFHTET